MKRNIKTFFVVGLLALSSILFAGCSIGDFLNETVEHTVTFNLMYDGAINSDVLVEDGAFVQEAQATREGYVLLGWYSDSLYNSLFNFATPITGDLNLYAKWQINTYTITLNKGYDNLTQTVNYTYGDSITLPTLERSTYNFDGWYLESTFNTLVNSSNIINQNINLYAKWSLITYSIIVESENEVYGTVELDYNLDTNYATINATANDGYEFNGWYVSDILWVNADQYSFTPNVNATIVARFKEIVTSTLNINASSGVRISTDGLIWKSTLTENDFGISFPKQVVSTDGTISNGLYQFYKATSGDGAYTLLIDNENYATFDLYFLNQGADDLTLSLSSLSSILDGINDKNNSLSVRIGFIVEGNSNDTITALGLMSGISSYIWEPNSTIRSASALANGAINNAKYSYYGISNDNDGISISNINAYGQIGSGSYSSLVNTTNDIAIGESNIVTVLPGNGVGNITKVKIFIWMEGQDVDCNNGTVAGDLEISLSFDTGSAASQLENKTATNIISFDLNPVLLLSGIGNAGATYRAYVLKDGIDANVSLDYKLLLGAGSVIYDNLDINEIILDARIDNSGTYEAIIVGELIGHIGCRTSSIVEYIVVDDYFGSIDLSTNNEATLTANNNEVIMPGDSFTYGVELENNGTADMYVRVKLTLSGETNLYELEIQDLEGYTYQDGYYIRNEVLFNSEFENLLLNFTIPSTLNEASDSYVIELTVESVQVANNGTSAFDATWN